MAQTKPKAAQFYGVSDNGTDGQFLKTDGTGGMSWDSPITNPTITSIDYPGSATAADPAGGESVIINGTNFLSGVTCTVGGTSAVTAFNSATQITITTPAKAAGQYTVAVTNTNGGTVSQANFIQYSGVPVWSTASGSLGSVTEGNSASFQVTATEGSDTIEYAVTTGSLPSGLSLNTNTGAITGTAPSVSASTTTTFSITATDDENQTSSERSFSITVANDNPSNYFSVITYTGTGATQSTNSLSNQSGTVNFKPDLVWIKQRNSGARNHNLTDTVRGASSNLASDTNASASQSGQGFSSFDSNGFTLDNSGSGGGGGNTNINGVNHVAWCFKAGGAAVANTDGGVTSQVSVNNTLGFSIVDYTAPGGTAIGHGLNGAPDLIILKGVNAAEDWLIYNSISGTGKYLSFNRSGGTEPLQSRSSSFSSVTATTFTDQWTSGSLNWIAYCFKSQPGFSKVGSYTGARPNDVLVQTGFKPAFIIIKAIDATDDWFMVDDKREGTSAPTKALLANSYTAESSFAGVQFLTNGFKLVGSANSGGTNNSGTTFLYIAFAADPSTTTPSLANSFNTTLYNGSSSTPLNVNGVGFKADFSWLKVRNNTWSHGLFSSLMPYGVNGGVKNVYSNNTDAATDLWGTLTWNNNGWTLNGGSYDGSSAHDFGASPYNYVSWNWKAGGLASINTDGSITSLVSANQAAGFSILKWTGTGAQGTIGHGLASAPQMVISKNLSSSNNWNVYQVNLGLSHTTYPNWLYLNATNEEQDSGSSANHPYYQIPSSTLLYQNTGTSELTNVSGSTYISYCFTSIAGYSKVGSYVGTGSAGNPQNVGFAPSFVLLKMATSTESWWVFDTDRTDKRLEPNTQDAEANETRFTFTSTGFSFTSGWSNDSGETFIYLAIKEN